MARARPWRAQAAAPVEWVLGQWSRLLEAAGCRPTHRAQGGGGGDSVAPSVDPTPRDGYAAPTPRGAHSFFS